MGEVTEGSIDLRGGMPVEAPGDEDGDLRAAEVVLRNALRPDETVIGYAEGLVRVVLQLFEGCAVLLTDQRLLLAKRAWVDHWEVKAELASASCEVIENRVRFDTSRVLVAREGETTLCLYFGHRWRDAAGVIAGMMSGGKLLSLVACDPYDAEQEAMALLHDMSAAALAGP